MNPPVSDAIFLFMPRMLGTDLDETIGKCRCVRSWLLLLLFPVCFVRSATMWQLASGPNDYFTWDTRIKYYFGLLVLNTLDALSTWLCDHFLTVVYLFPSLPKRLN